MQLSRKKIVPRGIRNNNPLNIRIGNTWLGEVLKPTDPDFEQFVTMEYGIRAAFIILRRYIRRYRKDTITQIISTWAPAAENQTQKYIDFVSDRMGIPSDERIIYEDSETMCSLVASMCEFENGLKIDYGRIQRAYKMA